MKPSNGVTPKRVPESDSSEPGQWKSHFLLVEFLCDDSKVEDHFLKPSKKKMTS